MDVVASRCFEESKASADIVVVCGKAESSTATSRKLT